MGRRSRVLVWTRSKHFFTLGKNRPLEKKNSRKKCLAVPKKIERGDPLVLPGMVCYAEKQENFFGPVR